MPELVEELAAQWAERTWCGPDRTARRLARFGSDAAGAVPYLRRFWLRTPHSYERSAYLEALAAINRDGLDYVYTESLWDCEETARLQGISSAPATPEALGRIALLRDDPMETPEVRAAARARLLAPSGLGQTCPCSNKQPQPPSASRSREQRPWTDPCLPRR